MNRNSELGQRALVIAAWFGPLPPHFSLWAESCGANSQFDFLLVTDQCVAAEFIPANLQINNRPFGAIMDVFSHHTEMKLTFANPYKLCDFKPLYHLLAGDLAAYNYWGFCDLDVIFGDLSLVTKGRLGRYDMLLGEGHLRFLRNCASVKNAWRHLDWQRIFSDPITIGMDEHHHLNRLFRRGNEHGFSWYNDPAKIADIDPGFRQFRLIPSHRNYPIQSFLWDGQKIFREFIFNRKYHREEFAYIHFQKRFMPMVLPKNFCSGRDGAIIIGPNGFVPHDGMVTVEAIKARNPSLRPNAKEIRLFERHWRHKMLRSMGVIQHPFEAADNI